MYYIMDKTKRLCLHSEMYMNVGLVFLYTLFCKIIFLRKSKSNENCYCSFILIDIFYQLSIQCFVLLSLLCNFVALIKHGSFFDLIDTEAPFICLTLFIYYAGRYYLTLLTFYFFPTLSVLNGLKKTRNKNG